MANIAIYKFNSEIDTLPIFESNFEYTISDSSNGDGTITRTITANTAPSSISFDSLSGLLEVNYINTENLNNLSHLFKGCTNLTFVDLNNINTANINDLCSQTVQV